ncbi:protein of unknown function [Taphrina deformans PYCC 5710]|uniref:C3H1-type domain-containing protein n=1 Tax=Taphrina deformans (strain PYCC 5710 / ATCC 11124 / CBS 356.35 / IMI 108563 / JCM 9778 / NBRC 8474) TaxID=1097556 RepID=R4XF07_TAPDE|nr:protein of unknown function [Taphrina deformans PYCC 5710]|eukprot:CCG84366.1 protein of unknown function [Taphrina deformans PYCC 5710]
MATCDPVLSPADIQEDSKDSVVPGKLSDPKSTKDETDPKIKQTALLSVVCSEIKGAMIEEVSQNKSIRAKLRTWFVRAHKDNSFVVLKALIAVLDKLTFLTAQSLAEVKFGKALLIVSRKCEDKDVRELLVKWTSKAEESLAIEREMEIAASKPPPIQEESKKKKAKSSGSKSGTPQISDSLKKNEEKAKDIVQKKVEPVAKTNAAFFKKDNIPAAKALIAKPGMAAALAGIKARKKTESDGSTQETKPQDHAKSNTKSISSITAKLPTGKPVFSALKLVEGLKRSASPIVTQENEPDSKRLKKRKRVSWRPDSELEQIQIFETIEPEAGSWEAPQTPHEFGNARDLDRKEGAMLHGGVLPDRDEDFIDWEIPAGLYRGNYATLHFTNVSDIDFSYRSLSSTSETRGPKKAGSMSIHSKFSQAVSDREASVLLVEYSSETDLPWSPSETIAMNEQRTYEARKPKLIPLPAELRDDWRVLQVLGDLTSPQIVEDHKVPVPLEQRSTDTGKAAEPALVQSPTPDITAILASIMAAQQKSSTVPNINPVPSAVEITTPQKDTPKHETGGSALPVVDHKLAEFLAQMATTNGGFAPPPLPPCKHDLNGSTTRSLNIVVPLPPMTNALSPAHAEAATESAGTDSGSGHPLPSQFGGLRDVRPWVRFNDNGKYREPCRFVAIGKCEKGNQCGYLHLDVPGPRT